MIEVSDSTLAYDQGEKLATYARLGVPEYWIVDLVKEQVAIYADPDGERYRSRTVVERGGRVAPRAFPDDAIAVDDILPPLAQEKGPVFCAGPLHCLSPFDRLRVTTRGAPLRCGRGGRYPVYGMPGAGWAG